VVSDETLEGDLLRSHLHGLGVTFHTDVTVLAYEEGAVTGETGLGDDWSLDADGLVLVTQQVSDDGLYRDLTSAPDALATAGISRVHRIGDAEAPAMPSEAIFSGHRLARELESDQADFAQPWRRELPAL
jgi:dimethylamine/trimethylamine dehydrogenase